MKKQILYIILSLTIISCNSYTNNSEQPPQKTEQFDPVIRDSIKNIILNLPENKNASGEYLSYFGFRDWYRWPLVYPYSLNSIDIEDNGFLCGESSAVNVTRSQEGIEQIHLGDIKKFSFNDSVLIAETADTGVKKYKMFRFSDKVKKNFSSLNEMYEESSKYGDMITDSLVTLKMYSSFFH